MTADNQNRLAISVARLPRRLNARIAEAARIGLSKLVPQYARYRARQAEMAGAIARLQAEFEHVRERHDEQIERLEDLARELVLAVEALRRVISEREQRD
jgi:hypothetical protein